MGTKLSSIKPEKREEVVIIFCDNNGHLIDANKEFREIIGYDLHSVRDKFIGFLMSPFLEYLHRTIYIPQYNKSSSSERKASMNHLNSRTADRPLIIYDLGETPLYVNIFFSKEIVNEMKCIRLKINVNMDDNIEFIFSRTLRKPIQNSFALTHQNCVITFIDFIDSTKFLTQEGGFKMANKCSEFYRQVFSLIKLKFYPYIFIHEIVGDCFVLITNADWSYKIPHFCSSITLEFLKMLIEETKNIMKLRIGCAYGDIIYGYIGQSLRLFGETMNLAARLEQCGKENHINVCEKMMNKLLNEPNLIKEQTGMIEENEVELKGFGKKKIYSIKNDISVIKKFPSNYASSRILSLTNSNEYQRRLILKHIQDGLKEFAD